MSNIIEFKNVCKIVCLEKKSKNTRGVRSNYISCPCFDTEKKEWVFANIDTRVKENKLIPHFSLYKLLEYWHNSDLDCEVYEFLGMTEAEYAKWVEESDV